MKKIKKNINKITFKLKLFLKKAEEPLFNVAVKSIFCWLLLGMYCTLKSNLFSRYPWRKHTFYLLVVTNCFCVRDGSICQLFLSALGPHWCRTMKYLAHVAWLQMYVHLMDLDGVSWCPPSPPALTVFMPALHRILEFEGGRGIDGDILFMAECFKISYVLCNV